MNLILEHPDDTAAERTIRAALPIAERGGRDVGPGMFSQADYMCGVLEALYEAGMLVEPFPALVAGSSPAGVTHEVLS